MPIKRKRRWPRALAEHIRVDYLQTRISRRLIDPGEQPWHEMKDDNRRPAKTLSSSKKCTEKDVKMRGGDCIFQPAPQVQANMRDGSGWTAETCSRKPGVLHLLQGKLMSGSSLHVSDRHTTGLGYKLVDTYYVSDRMDACFE